MHHWAFDSVFYHIYPLGMCGAPAKNNFSASPVARLEKIYGWLDHLQELGINAVYLGPLFESSRHGYDTVDYFQVDRRLGTNDTLAQLVSAFHQRGMRVILDGVLNHVGRDFWAFRDVLKHKQESSYHVWFQDLFFDGQSPYGDPFIYKGWNGHYDLVTLNNHNLQVRDHLFQAVQMWVHEFEIDGLRLDAADCLNFDFLSELAGYCRRLNPDFWLLGEVVQGDYRRWANPQILDAVTNYECYKGLYSSLNDQNYYEIAYSLNRQFGEFGIYNNLPLYNFADNHDVNRIISNLQNPAHLYPLYCLLFTMPGVPSIYYGSEWGIAGKKRNGSDYALRPSLDLAQVSRESNHPDLVKTIARLAHIRRNSPALCTGDYHQILVNHQQFVFSRQNSQDWVIVAINASNREEPIELRIQARDGAQLIDLLNKGDHFEVKNGKVLLKPVWPNWARILSIRQ
jgi:cyclomaltodextrinase / maltogenic alpha-amylase / neopullulanase